MAGWDTSPEAKARLQASLRAHARNLVEPDFSESLGRLKREKSDGGGDHHEGRPGHLAEAEVQLPQGQGPVQGWHLTRREAGAEAEEGWWGTLARRAREGDLRHWWRTVGDATPPGEAVRTFTLYRLNPPAEYLEKGLAVEPRQPQLTGVTFSNGGTWVLWLTGFTSVVMWPNFETFFRVHGHPEYDTELQWLDEPSST
jgi:hypothetical protein